MDFDLPALLLVLLPLIGTVVGGSMTAVVTIWVASKNRDGAKELERFRRDHAEELESVRHDNTAILESARAAREDQQRWDNHLRELCSKLIAIEDDIDNLRWKNPDIPITGQIDAIRRLMRGHDLVDLSEDELKEWNRAYDEMEKAMAHDRVMNEKVHEFGAVYYQVELMAPKVIVEAATTYLAATLKRADTVPGVDESDEGYKKARGTLIKAVRDKLGVSE